MFKRVSNASISGTSLQAYFEEPHYTGKMTHEKMVGLFGKPDYGYWDDEKGYDGNEWLFIGEHGEVINVYSRWGEFRVGAFNREAALNFCRWVSGLDRENVRALLGP